jgi:hypothetical protein
MAVLWPLIVVACLAACFIATSFVGKEEASRRSPGNNPNIIVSLYSLALRGVARGAMKKVSKD